MNLLISPEEAKEQMSRDRLPIIIDGRSEEEYQAGHLPGAIWVNTWDLVPEDTTMSGLFDFNSRLDKRCRVLGRFEKVDLIVYGDGFDRHICRHFWLFHYAGQLSSRLLEGGISGWLQAGGELTTEMPQLDPCPFAIRQRRDVIARYDEVQGFIDDDRVRLVDARSPEAFAKWHLPGARNLPSTRLMHEGKLLAPEGILKIVQSLEVEARTPIVVYSERGAQSAMVWIALRLIGLRKARSFLGGLEEWRRREAPND